MAKFIEKGLIEKPKYNFYIKSKGSEVSEVSDLSEVAVDMKKKIRGKKVTSDGSNTSDLNSLVSETIVREEVGNGINHQDKVGNVEIDQDLNLCIIEQSTFNPITSDTSDGSDTSDLFKKWTTENLNSIKGDFKDTLNRSIVHKSEVDYVV